ncbi:MAG: hypothetical protein AAF716_10495 [Cyanobacteria bacterium P01_D01_bin.1]
MTQRHSRQPLSQRHSQFFSQPLDRAAATVMALLTVVIVAMLLLGSQALPRVREFSWQNQTVMTDDIAFLLTFSQPMDPQSVEENLIIEPALSGKFSWAGRLMAYTLDLPAPYGETYKITLPDAQALNRKAGFEPFESEFESRDRVFAYIGSEGDEAGRLILFNLTQKKKTLLTSEGQLVLDFQPYPERDRILFSAVSAADNTDRTATAQLYSVTTGLSAPTVRPRWQFWPQQPTAEAGTTKLILDNSDYQNLNFDLSPDGKTIVVQRVSQNNPADLGQWILQANQPPRKLDTEPGGDFRIAPDNSSLLLQQGQGTAILSLDPVDTTARKNEENQPDSQSNSQSSSQSDTLIDFLPDYGLALDIASDGSSAALVNYNQDDPERQFLETLFLVSNRGEEKRLLDTDGRIVSAQFDKGGKLLYSLVTQVVGDKNEVGDQSESDEPSPIKDTYRNTYEESYQESPYLAVVNVETGKAQKLIELPPQSEITLDLAPDGLAILFDEAIAEEQPSTSDYVEPTHRLWLLPLFSTLEERKDGTPVALTPTSLDIVGRHPIWLP